MKMKVTALIAAALCGTGLIAACGSDASSPDGNGGTGGGSSGGDCTNADQIFPMIAGCDEATRMCQGATVPPDTDACNECLMVAQQIGQTINDLTTCACNRCAIFLAACFQSATREPGGDATRDANCRAVVECAQRTGCAGTDCYCGTGVTLDVCLMMPGQGPCAMEIATAGGCMLTDAVCVATARGDANTALGRASAVGACTLGDPGAMPPVVGNCTAM